MAIQQHLAAVPSTAPEPPYPATTANNGFRQEFDFGRILTSRTWMMADSECRPWLLMIWGLSWRNVPCGTWEPDDEYIAAAIGCKFEWFQGHRSQLMRGWAKCSDGLLYHPFITIQVHEMIRRRGATTERVRKHRGTRSCNAEVTPCNALPGVTYAKEQEQEQDTKKVAIATRPIASRRDMQPCPFSDIRNLWIEILPSLPQPLPVEHWTEARKTQIRARWRDELPDLDAWRDLFRHVAASDFLMGRTRPTNGDRVFQADLAWITRPANLLKICEGKYHA